MNLLVVTYPVLLFMTLGFKREPWFYGFSSEEMRKKSKSFKMSLISFFMMHSCIAVLFATKTLLRWASSL